MENMKIVILVDSNIQCFDKMVDLVQNKDIILIDTERCDEANEYRYLIKTIDEFSKSNSEIMLGKFSGRESVIKELGDERSEMILALSSKKNSRHYAGKPIDMFLNLISMFEKEIIST
jgi:hypothetical protein